MVASGIFWVYDNDGTRGIVYVIYNRECYESSYACYSGDNECSGTGAEYR